MDTRSTVAPVWFRVQFRESFAQGGLVYPGVLPSVVRSHKVLMLPVEDNAATTRALAFGLRQRRS
jgi:hypothetical protein